MPIKSKSQARFMGMVAAGVKKVAGLSKEKAKEFLRATPSIKKLPTKSRRKR